MGGSQFGAALAWVPQEEGGRPATQEMCSMRTFPCHCGEMIYDLFSNKSQHASCTGPPGQQMPRTTTPQHLSSLFSTAGTSAAFLFLSKPNLICTVKFSIFGHPYCMSANWNKRKDGGERVKTHEWASCSGVGWRCRPGRLSTPGPPGRWCGLRVT